MAKTEQEAKPLTRDELRMVSEFRKYRDIYKAAEKSGIAKNQAVRVFNKPEFQEELDRQDETVRLERARQQVDAEKLTNELIDSELTKVLRLDAKEHGTLKMDAIRTALVVNGRIQSGTMRSLEVGAQRENDDGDTVKTGTVYQALFQPAAPAVVADLMPTEPAAPAGNKGTREQENKAPAQQTQPKTQTLAPPASTRPRTGPLKVG